MASVVADTHAWVYSGPNPLQAGVTPGTIRRAQGSALRGRVLGEAGTPLGGVAVTVRNHPELGSTTTQTNGEYILVVNGGSPLNIVLKKAGFLDAERAVDVPWSTQVQVDDAVIVQANPVVTAVNLSASSQPFQVVRGSPIADADGSRRGAACQPACRPR